MISPSEAYTIAEHYVKGYGEIYPGVTYGVETMQEFREVYYFDFVLVFADPLKQESFGGAPGFTVDKQTGKVKTIAFWQLAKLLE